MKTFHLHREMRLGRSLDEVFPFFAEPHNLEQLTPPWLRFRVLRSSTERIEAGTEIDYRLRVHGLPLRWRSRIAVWEPPYRFVDEQLRGPYRLWRHQHSFEPDGETTLARDWIEYSPLGGALVNRLLVARDIQKIFEYREFRLRTLFQPLEPA